MLNREKERERDNRDFKQSLLSNSFKYQIKWELKYEFREVFITHE